MESGLEALAAVRAKRKRKPPSRRIYRLPDFTAERAGIGLRCLLATRESRGFDEAKYQTSLAVCSSVLER